MPNENYSDYFEINLLNIMLDLQYNGLYRFLKLHIWLSLKEGFDGFIEMNHKSVPEHPLISKPYPIG